MSLAPNTRSTPPPHARCPVLAEPTADTSPDRRLAIARDLDAPTHSPHPPPSRGVAVDHFISRRRRFILLLRLLHPSSPSVPAWHSPPSRRRSSSSTPRPNADEALPPSTLCPDAPPIPVVASLHRP
uniref:Uncharacterized protein n=1 Tax=Leersia perrieri TaxID=77586 RepID=A0A0D9XSJ9_9ORYZ